MKGILVIEYDWADDADHSPIGESADRLADLIKHEGATPLGTPHTLYVAVGETANEVLAKFEP